MRLDPIVFYIYIIFLLYFSSNKLESTINTMYIILYLYVFVHMFIYRVSSVSSKCINKFVEAHNQWICLLCHANHIYCTISHKTNCSILSLCENQQRNGIETAVSAQIKQETLLFPNYNCFSITFLWFLNNEKSFNNSTNIGFCAIIYL